jgi:hypothetical protein
MRSFSFEHVFRAPSVDVVFSTYFDPRHTVAQDRELDITEREILERTETSDQLRRVCRVVPKRQLPALVRPLIKGQLHYLETAVWKKEHDRIEIEIRPSILSGRATISATYRLSPVSAGLIRRLYEGTVSVDVALISSRIECGIIKEFERSMPLAAACTQGFLDRSTSSVQAHA